MDIRYRNVRKYEDFSSEEESTIKKVASLGQIFEIGPFLTISGLGIYQPNHLQTGRSKDFYVTLNLVTKFQGEVTALPNQRYNVAITEGASKMQQDKHNKANIVGGGAGLKVKGNGRGTISNNISQHPSNASAIPINKSLPRQAQAGTAVVRAISKQRIGQTFEEFRRQNEELIISDILKYEFELGRKPEWLDLLCRFSRLELTAVQRELRWIYPHLFEVEEESEQVSEFEVVIA